MVSNSTTVEINCERQQLHQVENFVDSVTEQIFINASYYGNILTALTELFSILCELMPGLPVKYGYYTDFKTLRISLQQVENQMLSEIFETKKLGDISDSVTSKSAFLIHAFVDRLEIFPENELLLEFDIAALHHQIYEKRSTLLKNYFSIFHQMELSRNND